MASLREPPSSPQQKKPREEETKTATLSDVGSSRRAILKGVEASLRALGEATAEELETVKTELSDRINVEKKRVDNNEKQIQSLTSQMGGAEKVAQGLLTGQETNATKLVEVQNELEQLRMESKQMKDKIAHLEAAPPASQVSRGNVPQVLTGFAAEPLNVRTTACLGNIAWNCTSPDELVRLGTAFLAELDIIVDRDYSGMHAPSRRREGSSFVHLKFSEHSKIVSLSRRVEGLHRQLITVSEKADLEVFLTVAKTGDERAPTRRLRKVERFWVNAERMKSDGRCIEAKPYERCVNVNGVPWAYLDASNNVQFCLEATTYFGSEQLGLCLAFAQ